MKKEVERTQITVGGNLIDYPGTVTTRTADLTTIKCHWNSVVSTPKAKYACFDVKNFYLNTLMDRPEYMCFAIEDIPEEIIQAYNLHAIVHNGYVYVQINKGMYGLPQAGKLANQLLAKRLAKHGYFQCPYTPGFWKHTWRPISFTLVVDNFGIKYVSDLHAKHLLQALQQNYEVSTDWTGSLYCGITLKWDYDKRTVDLSMPNYVTAALQKFNHPQPARPRYSPYLASPKQYNTPIQVTEPPDSTKRLNKEKTKRVQGIVGTFLYYACAVYPTMLVALSALASQQSKATEKTEQAKKRFMDYAATNPSATIRYQASDMILKVHSDAGYLNEPQARSCAGGHFYFGKQHDEHFTNGPILNPTSILKHVASSATEAELGSLFVNAKETAILRNYLKQMGHPQEKMTIQTDNSATSGITNDTVKQQKSRAMDMRYFWICDREAQQQFHISWKPGKDNLADYFTKHHTPAHHKKVCYTFLHKASHLSCTGHCGGC